MEKRAREQKRLERGEGLKIVFIDEKNEKRGGRRPKTPKSINNRLLRKKNYVKLKQ